MLELLREVVLQSDGELSHVAGGGVLAAIREAGCIAKHGILHAEQPRLAGHQFGKGWFTAADMLGNCGGDVVRGFGDEGFDRL